MSKENEKKTFENVEKYVQKIESFLKHVSKNPLNKINNVNDLIFHD